jgi:hypothetical protein
MHSSRIGDTHIPDISIGNIAEVAGSEMTHSYWN